MAQEAYRVLLVEDEPEIADMLTIFFEGRNFSLTHAFDGAEALRRALTVQPHVILMDITLPDMDGYEICRQLRQQPRTSHIPVIFLTRRGGRDDRLAGLKLGADDFISKPFDVEELMLRMRNSIQRAARETQIDPHTGLPSARLLLPVIEAARANSEIAMLEFTLVNSEPLSTAYGALAASEVSTYVAHLIVKSVHKLGHEDDFIGYLDDRQYVVVCQSKTAEAIAQRVVNSFMRTVRNHYSASDLQGEHLIIDGITYPLMALNCRIFGPGQAWSVN